MVHVPADDAQWEPLSFLEADGLARQSEAANRSSSRMALVTKEAPDSGASTPSPARRTTWRRW
jgi:hypothetical protein